MMLNGALTSSSELDRHPHFNLKFLSKIVKIFKLDGKPKILTLFKNCDWSKNPNFSLEISLGSHSPFSEISTSWALAWPISQKLILIWLVFVTPLNFFILFFHRMLCFGWVFQKSFLLIPWKTEISEKKLWIYFPGFANKGLFWFSRYRLCVLACRGKLKLKYLEWNEKEKYLWCFMSVRCSFCKSKNC